MQKFVDFDGIDIVVCLNIKSMEAVEIPKDTFENVNAVEASVLTDNNPDLVVLVFITGTMSQYIEKGEKKLPVLKKAYMKQKHQQLDIMGYVPITVLNNSPSHFCQSNHLLQSNKIGRSVWLDERFI